MSVPTDPPSDGGDDDDPPLLPDEDLAPAPQPGQYRQRRGFGCLWQLLFFAVMVGLGVFAAATIRGKSSPSATTIESGRVGSVIWKVQSRVDEQQSRCVALFANGKDGPGDEITGGCVSPNAEASGADVQEAELPGTGTWVIFGQAPKDTEAVKLPLTNGSTEKAKLASKASNRDRYYVFVAPKGVHASGVAQLVK